MKIMVVDDNLLTRDMIKDLLSEMGHQVVGEADNGDEAIKLFAEQKPELVMLDMIMPGKTGLETLQEIRALDPVAKVVMVTAVQQEALTQELLATGAIAILHKPFMYADLEAVFKLL